MCYNCALDIFKKTGECYLCRDVNLIKLIIFLKNLFIYINIFYNTYLFIY